MGSEPGDLIHGSRGRPSDGLVSVLWFAFKMSAFAVAVYVVRPLRDLWRTLSRTHPVRVFTFHRVTDLCIDPITVSPRLFEDQIRYLARHHDVMGIEEAVASLVKGDRRRRPMAAVTFDDGYESVFATAFPIMRRLGVPGCAFVTTDFVGTERRFPHDQGNPVVGDLRIMSWEQLERLRSAGWKIGSHTVSHRRLAECDFETLRRELESSLEIIRRRFSSDRAYLAYPFGGRQDITDAGLEAAMQAGYAACFSNFGGDNNGNVDPARLRRTDIGANLPTLVWKARVHGIPPTWLRRTAEWVRTS